MRINARILIGALILAMSAAYSVAMFRGLEHHSGYHGNVYQALHPEAFADDPFMAPGRPTMLSLYYKIARGVGPLWLDDRFTILVFFLMTVVSLIGLDKTARLFGLTSLAERIALLALVLIEHRFFVTQVLLVDHYEFNPTAFAGPFVIWLLYGTFAGWKPLPWLCLMALAPLVSIKNSWLPVALSGILFCKDRLGPRGKRIAVACALGALALGLLGYYAFLRKPDVDAALFNYILERMDDAEANPFLYPLWVNLIFAGLCLTGFFLRDLPPAARDKIRWVSMAGLAVWFLGGLYLSCAPDSLKIPYLVPFDPARALRWPSYLLFLALGASLLKGLQKASSWKGTCAAWILLMVLYLFHLELRINLLLLVGAVTGAMLLFRQQWRRIGREPALRVKIAAAAMAIGTVSLYGVGAVHHRLSALKVLARYGIMGDNVGAKWLGVDEYVRTRTPLDATVVAFSSRDSSGSEVPFQVDTSLRTRAGRTMPIGHPAAFYFNYPKLIWWEGRNRIIQQLALAWERQDAAGVSRTLSLLGSPDYLVVPSDRVSWTRGIQDFYYQTETVIGGFTLLRKTPPRTP